jgi:hypothetical protein
VRTSPKLHRRPPTSILRLLRLAAALRPDDELHLYSFFHNFPLFFTFVILEFIIVFKTIIFFGGDFMKKIVACIALVALAFVVAPMISTAEATTECQKPCETDN